MPSTTRVFENGTNWIYALNYTIYPISGDYTDNDLWYQLTPPATGMLVSEAEATNTTLFLPLTRISTSRPPAALSWRSRTFTFPATRTVETRSWSIRSTARQPGSNATVYAGGPIILTNTATLTVGLYRNGRTPVFDTEIYTRLPGVQSDGQRHTLQCQRTRHDHAQPGSARRHGPVSPGKPGLEHLHRPDPVGRNG